jgi:hypothetical protein
MGNNPLMNKDTYSFDNGNHEAGDSLLFWGFLLVLTTYVIEGVLRYGLATAGFPNVIYLRDAVAVISIIFIFFRSLFTRSWIEPHIALICCVLLFHFLVGLFFGAALFQALFGFKVLVSLIFGVAVSPILEKNFSQLLVVMAFFFLISVLGVYINHFIEKMPWEGIEYDTAFGTVTGTREWWASGIRRLPGFARTSFDAAMIIGISGFACMLLFKRALLRLTIAAIALTAIILTTTKGMSQTFMVITLWMLFRKTPIFFPMGRLLVVTFLILAVALPSIVVFFDIGYGVMEKDVPSLLRSLWDRFSWMWPEAFDLMTKPEHYVFGKGLGSIGTAQLYGENYVVPNAADNIFVYTFVLFGPLSLLYLSYPAWCVVRMPSCGDIAVWCIGLLIICYDYGLTINMLEEPFFSSILGMVSGLGWKSIKSRSSRSNQSNGIHTKAISRV